MLKETVEREYDNHPSMEITVYNCPGEDCDHHEDRPTDLRRHIRKKHCAFCGAQEGVKYRFADHLGYERPGAKEWLRRRIEDFQERLSGGEQTNWEKHRGGVSHTLIEDLPDAHNSANTWHVVIACQDCREDYRRILEGATIARRDCQPYPGHFDFLSELKRAEMR